LWEIVAQWKEEGKRKQIMTHLVELFHEVNDDLNGDIFKRHACETVVVDSNILADIIESLYFPKSRYRFDAIGVELLGSIYERYLGSTIRVTPQRVKVEEKPEVRKAGGVYYTPKYIVDYIVKNTVGKIVVGKTPRQIEKIKILDPACGSGSFLLSAYQYLIDYHLKYYREHPKEAQTLHLFPYYKMSPEEFTLPIHEKAKILRNNIFGVDIDPQAVEITMMSLYLKALEGERGLLPKKQHLLPPLSNNIKCGNSLIGYDIFDNATSSTHGIITPPTPPLNLRGGREGLHRFGTVLGADSKKDSGQAGMTEKEVTVPMSDSLPLEGGGLGRGWDDETKSRINPFNWNSKSAGFGEIINPSQSPLDKGGSKGGFDVVIGNPPYIRQEMLGEFKEYFQKHYEVYHGVADLYAYFIERGISLLKNGGLFSYIVANKWMRANYGEPLRRWLKTQHIEEIIDFGDLPVFEKATTYPCIIRIRKYPQDVIPASGARRESFRNPPLSPLTLRGDERGVTGRARMTKGLTISVTQVKTLNFIDLSDYVSENSFPVMRASLDDKGWALVDEQSQTLLNKLQKIGIPLGEYVKGKIFRGVLTGLNEAFVIDKKTRDRLIAEDPKSAELIKPFLIGRDIKRYVQPQSDRYLILIPKGWTHKLMGHSREGGNPGTTGFRINSGMTETGAWRWFSESYPAIAAHLEPHK
jgi:type I restriction-modification system DNA methylase subunit